MEWHTSCLSIHQVTSLLRLRECEPAAAAEVVVEDIAAGIDVFVYRLVLMVRSGLVVEVEVEALVVRLKRAWEAGLEG